MSQPPVLMRNTKPKTTTKATKRRVGEAKRILDEVRITAYDLAETKYYGHIAGLFRDNRKFRRHLDRVLGSDPAPLVIYGLGSPERNQHSQYQLAVAFLLKRNFPRRIGDIELYDPAFSPADRKVLEWLGYRVLPTDERCRRLVDKPTLFFLPSLDFLLEGNLLETNWCPSRLNQMIILSNSLEYKTKRKSPSPSPSPSSLHEVYTGILRKYAKRFPIPTDFDGSHRFIFGELSFNFFEMDPQLDLKRFLPDDFEQRREETQDKVNKMSVLNHSRLRICSGKSYRDQFGDNFSEDDADRFPRRYRCKWEKPPAGWVKLNFSGRARDEVSPAGYGGILHDEYGKEIAKYSCGLGELADATVANAEALRAGMKLLKEVPRGVKQLVVEGTDLSVVRWARFGPEPPEKVKEAVDDIFKVAAQIKMVIYHVYEEANEDAIALAKEGATSQERRVWISSETRDDANGINKRRKQRGGAGKSKKGKKGKTEESEL